MSKRREYAQFIDKERDYGLMNPRLNLADFKNRGDLSCVPKIVGTSLAMVGNIYYKTA